MSETKEKTYTVQIQFTNKDVAKDFYDYYVEQGEQDYSMWQENHPDQAVTEYCAHSDVTKCRADGDNFIIPTRGYIK